MTIFRILDYYLEIVISYFTLGYILFKFGILNFIFIYAF